MCHQLPTHLYGLSSMARPEYLVNVDQIIVVTWWGREGFGSNPLKPMGNEDHSWALFRCRAVCGCVKCYQLISFFWMRGMQSVLGHSSQLKPVCHLYWVGRNLLPPKNNDFWFLSLLCWAKWGFVCYLDGNTASFHYYPSRGIKIKLLYSHTRLNLKSHTVSLVLTLCSWILAMKLVML